MLKIASKTKTLPAIKSITFDNGGEFTQFGLLSWDTYLIFVIQELHIKKVR